MLVTVLETDEFSRIAKRLLSEDQRTELTNLLAAHPESGVLLAGGVRKLRFARAGAGKSGGYRVIYFYRASANRPIFLITMFAKSSQGNLSAVQAAEVRKAGDRLLETYRKTS